MAADPLPSEKPMRLFGPSPEETPPWLLVHVASFVPWAQRGAGLLSLSAACLGAAAARDPAAAWWHALVVRLGADAGLYLGGPERAAQLARLRGGWRPLLLELWQLRRAFEPPDVLFGPPPDGGAPPRTFRLSAAARFRPASGREAAFGTTPMALPLHQRVAAARAADEGLTQRDAMRAAMAEAAAADEPLGVAAQVLDVRPGARGSALTVSPGCGLRAFELDHVFGADASQEAVFEAVGARDRGRGRRG